MCYRIGAGFSAPKTSFRIITSKGPKDMNWGLFQGGTYNSRLENLKSTWKSIEQNRGILSIESFWEGIGEFSRPGGINFDIGVIFTPKEEFSIITIDANSVVKPYHHRMPLCLEKSSAERFLEGFDDFTELSSDLFVLSRKLVA